MIQIEEPQIHLIAVRNIQDAVINPKLMVEVFNRTVKGLRAKTEVWAHSCWGNPSAQRMFASVQTYKPRARSLQHGRCRRDHLRIVGVRAASIWRPSAKIITGEGVHRRHRPPHAPGRAREEGRGADPRGAEAHPGRAPDGVERLRHGPRGMSRRHAFYKAVSIVLEPTSCARSSACRRRGCSPPTSAIRWWCRRSDRAARARDTSRCG